MGGPSTDSVAITIGRPAGDDVNEVFKDRGEGVAKVVA